MNTLLAIVLIVLILFSVLRFPMFTVIMLLLFGLSIKCANADSLVSNDAGDTRVFLYMALGATLLAWIEVRKLLRERNAQRDLILGAIKNAMTDTPSFNWTEEQQRKSRPTPQCNVCDEPGCPDHGM